METILLCPCFPSSGQIKTTQAGRLGFGQRPPTQAAQQNPVDQAREAVDAINGRMAQTYEAP